MVEEEMVRSEAICLENTSLAGQSFPIMKFQSFIARGIHCRCSTVDAPFHSIPVRKMEIMCPYINHKRISSNNSFLSFTLVKKLTRG